MKTNLKAGGLQQSFHAVSITAGLGACPAALALRQKRFLSLEAPALPLPACTSPGYCLCKYQHHSDRRTTLRRLTDRGGIPYPRIGKPELRKNPFGRRAADQT